MLIFNNCNIIMSKIFELKIFNMIFIIVVIINVINCFNIIIFMIFFFVRLIICNNDSLWFCFFKNKKLV